MTLNTMLKLLKIGGAAASAALFLAACSGDNPMATGKLKLAITDAPVDNATSVVVQFTGVEIQPANGDRIEFNFDTPRQIDLLALNGGGSQAMLDGVTVPAGRYDWVRLKLDVAPDRTVVGSSITLDDGTVHDLEIPSGAETGLKLVSGFVVPAGKTGDFTIDFDLRKSVHLPMNGSTVYVLRPALRIVDNAEVGEIVGTVDASLITTGCTPAVYVFDGANATLQDIRGTSGDPVTTAAVHSDGTYVAAFLAPGDYTAAFTCDAAKDDPGAADTLAFSAPKNATVTANNETVVNFP